MATGQLDPAIRYIRRVAVLSGTATASDRQLLTRFASHRDEAAFATLVGRHGPMVLAVCRRVLRDGHAAEDAFQATFLVLACKAARLRRPERLGPWLHGVAYRTALKARAASVRRQKHERQAAGPQTIGPAEDCVWRDLRPVLDEEIQGLPSRWRAAVVLCYLEERTNAEAAAVLGCSRGTVATLLARGRERLRRRLARRGLGLAGAGAALEGIKPAQAAAMSRMLQVSTARAAVLFAAGPLQAAGTLSGDAVALAQGVVKAMLMNKLKIVALIVLLLGFWGAGTGVAVYQARSGESRITETVAVSERASPDDSPSTASPAPTDAGGAWYGTTNFEVQAATLEIARQIGRAAERQRRDLALLWLGRELPAWPQPCPVQVTLSDDRQKSVSSFSFKDNAVRTQRVELEGAVDKILADLLPHEITHVVLAHWAGHGLPCWADEGAAILGESALSQQGEEAVLRQILKKGLLITLDQLLPLPDYGEQGAVLRAAILRAEGYSLTNFLVQSGGRRKFLQFLVCAERYGWDKAVQRSYGYRTVKELEQAWLAHVRKKLSEEGLDPGEALNKRPAGEAEPAFQVQDKTSRSNRTVRPGESHLVTRVYPVADLVMPEDKKNNQSRKSADTKHANEEKVPYADKLDRLTKLITKVVAPQTWSSVGGQATLEFFPLGLGLVVNQEPAVHEQIEELLAGLRAFRVAED